MISVSTDKNKLDIPFYSAFSKRHLLGSWTYDGGGANFD